MLSQVGDWYRTTELKDNDERLGQRRKAGEALVLSWTKAGSSALVDAVCLGLEATLTTRSEASPALPTVLDAIVDAQPSYERALNGTTLDARICVLMALSELVHRRLSNTSDQMKAKEPAVIAAQALICGLRFAPQSTGAFLDGRLKDLVATSEALLSKLDAGRRNRKYSPGLAEKIGAAGDDINGVKRASVEAIQAIAGDAALDREELQALWWVFGGYSFSQTKSFAELNPASAAIIAGSELAQLISWPGTLGMAALAARITAASSGDNDRKLVDFLSTISPEVWQSCVPPQDAAILEARAIVLPLSAAAINPKHTLSRYALLAPEISKAHLAQQMFSERSLTNALRS